MKSSVVGKVVLVTALYFVTTLGFADQMPDSSGSNQYVKTISIEAINPYPVFVVKSNGKEYTHVEGTDAKKTFNARVTGVCRSAKWVHSAGYNLSTTKYNGSNVATKTLYEPGESSKHKTFGTNKWVNIQWKPSKKLNDLALKTCKDHLQSEKNKGKSLMSILGEDKRIVVDSGIWGSFHLNCAGPLAAGVKHRFDMQPMEVRCEGSNVALNLKAKKVELLEIKSISLKPVVAQYTGICPKDFKFTGSINSNGAGGKVRYRFINHFGVRSAWKNATIPKGNTSFPVSYTTKLQDIEVKDGNGGIKGFQAQQGGMQPKQQLGIKENPYMILEVENANNKKKYTKKAYYKYKCTNPKISKGTIKGGSQTPGGKKPDLVVLGNTFQLGNKKATGSPTLKLNIGSGQATKKENGVCTFRMRYSIKNKGDAMAQPAFKNKVSVSGKSLHNASTLKLDKGKQKVISGNIKLETGDHLILVKTDNTKKVSESNENNNTVRISVKVSGNCGGGNGRPHPAR